MAVNVEQVVVGVPVSAAFFNAPHPGRSVAAISAAPAAAPIFNKCRRERPLDGMEIEPPYLGCMVLTKQRFLMLAVLPPVKSPELSLKTNGLPNRPREADMA